MNTKSLANPNASDTKRPSGTSRSAGLKFQAVDLLKYGMSRGELLSVIRAVGLEAVIDQKHPDAPLLNYLAYDDAKLEKLVEDPRLLKTPSSATESWPPWATSQRCGRAGSRSVKQTGQWPFVA